MNPDYDVVIAGAGPVGLFLACELRLGGVSVLVLEREPNPESALKCLPFGMRGLTIPSVEAFHRRGLLEDIVGSQRPARQQAGHFAGIPIDAAKIDPTNWPYRLDGPTSGNRAAEQGHIERVLANRAHALGAEIRRGVALDDFEESDAAVTIGHTGGQVTTRWLVGCDGGRSVVRKKAGFASEGTDPTFTGYSFAVDLADPERIPLGRHLTPQGMYYQTQPGHFGMLDFDGGAFHRTSALTLPHVQSVLRRLSGVDVTLTALHVATIWTDRAHQATRYRRGRVLLAGDAAHTHSPLGGQGLNTGLGDAMNLGWKLAATIRAIAPPDLLDSYETERHPVGAAVLDWSRAQSAILQPAPHARALEQILRDVVATRDGATYFAERVWGASHRHTLGGAHPLVGRSTPDFELGGIRLAELLRDGTGLILDFGSDPALRELGIRYVAAKAEERFGIEALLIRPDGVVAWAREDKADLAGARAAVARWFIRGSTDSALFRERSGTS